MQAGEHMVVASLQIADISYSHRRAQRVGSELNYGGLRMNGQGQQFTREEIEGLEQALERLVQTASKLDEIFQLLQEPGSVEAMMARLDEFVSGRMPVTVRDCAAGAPDDR